MLKDDVPKSITLLLTNQQEIKMQRDNLLQVLKMIILKGGCLHDQIEKIIGNPREPPPTSIQKCIHSCLIRLGTIDKFIMPVSRKGLCTFLAKVLINNTSASLTPSLLEDKFKKYANLGTTVYSHPRSSKAPPSKYISVTVLQLIAREIISMNFDASARDCSFRLVIVDEIPAYLTDAVWLNMFNIEE